MPKAMLVFHCHEIPDELSDDLTQLASDFHCGGNGFHIPWIVSPKEPDHNTADWIEVEFGVKMDKFFLSRGCQIGQELLILNEW